MNFETNVSSAMMLISSWCHLISTPKWKRAHRPKMPYWTKNYSQISFIAERRNRNWISIRSWRLEVHWKFHSTLPMKVIAGAKCSQLLLLRQFEKSIDRTMRCRETGGLGRERKGCKSATKTERPRWSKVMDRRYDHVIAKDEEDQSCRSR